MKTVTTQDVYSLGYELKTDPDHFGWMVHTDYREGRDILQRNFHRDGYLYLPGFWKREDILKVRRSVLNNLVDLELVETPFDLEKARLKPGKDAGRAFGNPLDQNNPEVRSLVFGERILDFFNDFLEGESGHFDFIWYRVKGPGLGSPVHSDMVYMGRGTPHVYSAWTPLGDINIEMGGLMVLEGSHRKQDQLREYLKRDVDTYCENKEDAEAYASGEKWWDGTLSKNPLRIRKSLGGRWLTADFKMGDVVIFGMTLVHGSLDNRSPYVRLSTDTRYQLASEPFDERWVGEVAGHGTAMKRGRIC